MLYEVRSKKALTEIDTAIQEASARNRFGVLAVHDLPAAMRSKGVDFDGEVHVYEVCNPLLAKRALEENRAVSTMLPCRIAVYGSGDGYVIATVRPTEQMAGFGGEGLAELAKEVEEALIRIMDEAGK